MKERAKQLLEKIINLRLFYTDSSRYPEGIKEANQLILKDFKETAKDAFLAGRIFQKEPRGNPYFDEYWELLIKKK